MSQRAVGRPRIHDHDAELELLVDAGYAALRDHGDAATMQHILAAAGVSTRSFYRHFDSKEALFRAMFRRDAEWAADRLTRRLAALPDPRDAVVAWVDELYSFVRNARRAERVSVLGTLQSGGRSDVRDETANARRLLVAPLRAAIVRGQEDGSFAAVDPDVAAAFIAASVLDATGLTRTVSDESGHQDAITALCLRALASTQNR